MRELLFLLASLVVASSAQRAGYPTTALQCSLNEVPSCVKPCPPERTCRNRNIAFSCAYDERPCTPKCVCADGYYRNTIGECITGAECDKCQKPNEFYSCNSACDNVCADIATQNRTNCPILNIKCNEMCYCDDGYARDAKGNCIPVSQCPKPVPINPWGTYATADHQCTDPNEEIACKTSCPPETCISIVARFKCDSKEICKTQCWCKPGYLRVQEGSPCVPTCQCPQISNSPDCKT